MASDNIEAVTEAIEAAPLTPGGWATALRDMAELTGGWGGQLLGLSHGRLMFDLSGGVDLGLIREFEDRGGADPTINPRAEALLQAPEGSVLIEPDFIGDDQRARHPLYQEFLNPVGAPYCLGAVVAGQRELRIVVASLRSARQGPGEALDQRRLGALTPALQAAAKLQIHLERQAAALALGAFERMTIPAALLDGSGQVVATTSDADRILIEGSLLARTGRMIRAAASDSDRDLQRALDQARCSDDCSRPTTSVLLRSRDGGEALGVDVFRLPATGPFNVEARVMVVIGARRQRREGLLARMGLTPSEVEIGLAVFDGLSPPEIAGARQVSIETVRSQIKSVHAKLGAQHKAQLLSKLRSVI